MKNQHFVYVVISKANEEKSLTEREPDWFFRQRIKDYICSCQNGRRLQGSCVHVQAAIYGATLSIEEKNQFVRKKSTLNTENFKSTFDDDYDAEEGEEYLSKYEITELFELYIYFRFRIGRGIRLE